MFERFSKAAPVLAALAAFIAAQSALAITTLKSVQVSAKDGDQIELVFDGRVGKSQVRTEFFNDVIQVSLTDVSVYPAKISSVNGNDLIKIFAYQYAPKLVRCRFTVKGKAEDFKDKLEIATNGRVMSVRVGAVKAAAKLDTDQISAHQAHPAPAPEAAKADAPKAADAAEKSALLDHVMGAIAEKDKPKPAAKEAPRKEAAAAAREKDKDDEPVELGRGSHPREKQEKLAGGKPMPSPVGVFAKLALVLALFGAIALIMKKLSRSNASKVSASHQLGARLNARLGAAEGGANWMGALGGLATSAAKGLVRKDKLIEVVSNHHLGPKKSIAVVKVMGRLLVLGVSNDAINLITQIEEGQNPEDLDLAALGGDVTDSLFGPSLGAPAIPKQAPAPSARGTARQMGYGASAAGPSVFSNMLKEEQAKPQAPSSNSVRSQIKNRLEGLKQL